MSVVRGLVRPAARRALAIAAVGMAGWMAGCSSGAPVRLSASTAPPKLTTAPIASPSGSTAGDELAKVEQQVANAVYVQQKMIDGSARSAADRQALRQRAVALMRQVFTSAQQDREQAVINKVIRDFSCPGWIAEAIDGGIGWAHFDSVDMSGDAATASAHVQSWLTSQPVRGGYSDEPSACNTNQVPPGVSVPPAKARALASQPADNAPASGPAPPSTPVTAPNVLVVHATLTRASGEWLVASISWDFAAGGGP